ncbi:MAG: DNA adenine methylase [Bacteroidaceae bacterium]|nr:DNA adenine methylase [Bacteroidaceae bacterium]
MSVPETEGIKYTGSKLKILPYIIDMVGELGVKSALDAFSGTTRVAQAFSQIGYDTTSNDISVWSEVFGTCYLLSKQPDSFYIPYLEELNSLEGYKGWFSENYGGEGEDGKMPFQMKNTMRLDAIRDKIDEYDLTWEDKCVLLTSLIYAMDAVDNTLGHYAAYLSGWSPRSYNDIVLKLPKRHLTETTNKVVQGDVFDVVKDYHDLVYLDPPYGSNNEKMPPSRVRYAAYYHIWKTIILNDKPKVFGKARRREDTRDTVSPSLFEEYKKNEQGNFIAMQAIKKLIEQTNAHYILLSYGSGGRATKEELNDILHSNGKVIAAQEINYKKNVMSNMRWTNEWINSDGKYNEYLFLLEK